MNENLTGSASFRPLTAVADGSIVTWYVVAYGRGRFGSGVKMRIVVPDQRNVPCSAGEILKNGGRTRAGIRPSVTMGSEKTTRTSSASARLATSPWGPAFTIVSGACPCRKVWAATGNDTEGTISHARIGTMRFMIGSGNMGRRPD